MLNFLRRLKRHFTVANLNERQREIILALEGRLAGGVFFRELAALMHEQPEDILAYNLRVLKNKGLVKWPEGEEVYYSFIQLD